MGIKSFSKLVSPVDIKLKDIKSVAVDASVIMYQAALGAKSIKTLTDDMGNSTLHISVILSKVLNFKKNNIKQIWVFDFHEKNYTPPNKALELAHRKKRRDNAVKKLTILKKKQIYDELFSSDDETDSLSKNTQSLENKINMQEKQCFSMNDKIINDVKFILNSFNILWVTAKKGIEAEHLCAALTNANYVDAVFSTDVDALMYGATKLIRNIKIKGKKVLQEYVLSNILKNKKITISELRKIGVIMGCDHAKKTANIGPKTVLKKYKDIKLTLDQQKAVKIFEKKIDITEYKQVLDNYHILHITKEHKKIDILVDWLINKKFNKERVKKQIIKVYKSYK
jgi:5'-3' exonuclease